MGWIERAPVYGLTRSEAHGIVEQQLTTIRVHWDEVCDAAELAPPIAQCFTGCFRRRGLPDTPPVARLVTTAGRSPEPSYGTRRVYRMFRQP